MGEALRVSSVCVHDEHLRRGLSLRLIHISRESDPLSIRRPAGIPVRRLRAVCEPASAGAVIVHDENITIDTKNDLRLYGSCSSDETEQTAGKEKDSGV